MIGMREIVVTSLFLIKAAVDQPVSTVQYSTVQYSTVQYSTEHLQHPQHDWSRTIN